MVNCLREHGFFLERLSALECIAGSPVGYMYITGTVWKLGKKRGEGLGSSNTLGDVELCSGAKRFLKVMNISSSEVQVV